MTQIILLFLLAIIVLAFGACPGQNLLENPEHPGEWGPWPTGSRQLSGTFTKRDLVLQVLYPAVVGSEAGKPLCKWDLRDHMPAKQANKIPDSATPMPDYEHCSEDLPLDTEHGPYPLIVFIHGTGGFRTQSAQLMTHWASRGFVVVSADYPGIQLYDMLNIVNLVPPPRIDQPGDTRLLMEELASLSDSRFAFLRSHMDYNKSALIGHSAGASALQSLHDLARVLIPMAGHGVTADRDLESTLILAALNDSVVKWTNGQNGYKSSPKPKRFAVVEKLGHHFCSDLCWIGEDQGGIVKIAVDHGIVAAEAFKSLANDGCHFENPKFAEPPVGWAFTRYATSATLEETLHCNPLMTEKARDISKDLRTVYMYQEDL